MREYKVEVTETLSQVITVEADNEEDALDIVRDSYFNEELVLDSSDYIDTDFQIYEEQV